MAHIIAGHRISFEQCVCMHPHLTPLYDSNSGPGHIAGASPRPSGGSRSTRITLHSPVSAATRCLLSVSGPGRDSGKFGVRTTVSVASARHTIIAPRGDISNSLTTGKMGRLLAFVRLDGPLQLRP